MGGNIIRYSIVGNKISHHPFDWNTLYDNHIASLSLIPIVPIGFSSPPPDPSNCQVIVLIILLSVVVFYSAFFKF